MFNWIKRYTEGELWFNDNLHKAHITKLKFDLEKSEFNYTRALEDNINLRKLDKFTYAERENQYIDNLKDVITYNNAKINTFFNTIKGLESTNAMLVELVPKVDIEVDGSTFEDWEGRPFHGTDLCWSEHEHEWGSNIAMYYGCYNVPASLPYGCIIHDPAIVR